MCFNNIPALTLELYCFYDSQFLTNVIPYTPADSQHVNVLAQSFISYILVYSSVLY